MKLFRGRYKSIIVSPAGYLLQLVRYIHRYPIKAGLVKTLDSYKRNSYKGYLSIKKKWDWLYKTFIYSLITEKKTDWIKRYRQLISIEDGDIPQSITLDPTQKLILKAVCDYYSVDKKIFINQDDGYTMDLAIYRHILSYGFGG